MTLTLNLPDDLQTRLSLEAFKQGMPLPDYIVRLLSGEAPARAPSGGEVVAYWQRESLVGARPDIQDSQAHARALRAQAERRNWP